MSTTFTKTLTVVATDLDELQHVNNVRYVEWIQEISRQHWQEITQGAYDQRFVWVVRNHNITYYQAAQLHDELLVTTWVDAFKGPLSTRKVTIENNKTGQLLVEGITDWCFLDVNSMRPKRVPDQIEKLF